MLPAAAAGTDVASGGSKPFRVGAGRTAAAAADDSARGSSGDGARRIAAADSGCSPPESGDGIDAHELVDERLEQSDRLPHERRKL